MSLRSPIRDQESSKGTGAAHTTAYDELTSIEGPRGSLSGQSKSNATRSPPDLYSQ